MNTQHTPELPESLRDPLKVLEHGRMLNQLLEQRNAAWALNADLLAALRQIAGDESAAYPRPKYARTLRAIARAAIAKAEGV